MTEQQLNRKLAYLPSKVNTIVGRVVRNKEREIIKRNQQQLEKGQDSIGMLRAGGSSSAYGSYKDKGHIKKRRERGLQTAYVDLKFFGQFQRGMYVKSDGSGITIGSTDKKADILVHHWGEDIFGLNDANFDWLLNEITNALYTELKQYFA
jgi:hypothetical protein